MPEATWLDGHVADHGLAGDEVLLAGFADLALTRRADVRVRVHVQVVVVDDRAAGPTRAFGRAAVRRSGGREALVVGATRREHEAGARDGPDADALGLDAGDVAEGERPVVALRLLGRDAGEHRIADFDRVREVFEGQRDDGVVAELRQRFRGFGERRVELGGGSEVDRAFFEAVREVRRDRDEVCGRGTKQMHELGRVVDQRRLVGKRVDRLFERFRTFGRGFFELLGDARPGREERVEVDVLRGLLFGHRRGLFGGAQEAFEEAGEIRLRRGDVREHRNRVVDHRAEFGDRLVEAEPAAREAVAEVVGVDLDGLARFRVEHVEEFLDVHGFTRLAGRDRFAGVQFLGRGALFEFQVLEADRRDRQDDRSGVGGELFDALFELQIRDRRDLAGVRVLLRAHRVDDAHARPGYADLI